MLQGFFWDSYSGANNSKWSTLTSQADEIAPYFKVIWVPNAGKAATNPSMGYDPVYWFTNHTSSFGTKQQLIKMISAYNALGTDIIEDVVVNHRSGVTNWTDFPSEVWNGKTYKLGPEHICSDDEVASQSGQAKPTGARDTGEGFSGSRDLDHTSPVVQENVIAYCQHLMQDLGFSGFRYDMVKGYSAKYTKIYNEASKPKYSVGEYWDGSYDKVAAWIEGTGRQSAAFDFPLKYCINEAFANNDMTKLVWLANGVTPQPAGLIHYNYPQYAVTFVDNHDTYRDGSKFNGNVLAANAFILCSPGTPCVFLPHWQKYKEQIKPMIAIRNACGVNNQSSVKVLRYERDCYLAEVKGTKGSLVVKIGNASVTPDGYTNSDIRATGSGYCIWSKTKIDGNSTVEPDPVDPTYPQKVYLMGNLTSGHWDTSTAIPADEASKGVYKWHEVELEAAADNNYSYFSFTTAVASTVSDWDLINASDRYGATSNDLSIKLNNPVGVKCFYGGGNAGEAFAWKAVPGTYSFTLDLSQNSLVISEPTAVGLVDDDILLPAVYYNLQGIRVENPAPGIYVKRQGSTMKKVLIKN
ncbi:MAG: alpha-amylase family glycosyl hydrolase [Muribaculum sp.]|nr:alpha-amylase family glycosyl hydrolase [Muribaculum sp.]